MNSRERVARVLEHKRPDRLPVDLGGMHCSGAHVSIVYGLRQALGLDESRIQRVIFNEITESAIKHAFEHPHSIDLDKVYAQQARRVLDRIVGYELSPLLWRKIAKGLSAGRVQSVAAKLIVEREREIRAFVPQESWKVSTAFTPDEAAAEKLAEAWHEHVRESPSRPAPTQKERARWLSRHGCFRAELVRVGEQTFAPQHVDEVRPIIEALGYDVQRVDEEVWAEYADHGLRIIELVGRTARERCPQFAVREVQTKRTTTKPSPPFTTATLQQAAAINLRFGARKTMRVAQALYEGIDLGDGEGPSGLITYMRTDSLHLSRESVSAVRELIGRDYGAQYVPGRPPVYGKRGRAQEAHEAIRPTVVTRSPAWIKEHLTRDQYRLYELIWNRFVASQMSPAQWDSTTVLVEADTPAGRAQFRATGRVLVFDGHLRVMSPTTDGKEQLLPALAKDQAVHALALEPKQAFSAPPPRYTEASLVKSLEAEGIGRPSTYAAIIDTIQSRGYVEQLERKFHATALGEVVTDMLTEHFPQIMDTKFTAFMEDELDKIEEQHKDWVAVLHEFYDPFREALAAAMENIAKVGAQPSEYTCEKCGRPMVYRWSKSGRFLSCSGYPECRETLNVDREGKPRKVELTDHACELCGRPMVLRSSRRGKFLGCSGYPECNGTIPCDQEGQPLRLVREEDIDETCAQCGSKMVVRWKGSRSFLGC